MNTLNGKKVAILAANGFEESELFTPKDRLEREGASTHIVSISDGEIKGWQGENWGRSINVDHQVEHVNASDYDALLIPGGVANPDILRRSTPAINFTRDFFKQGKPVASICHGPQVLIEADVVKDRELTSFSSIKTDLVNAGAKWKDQEVVVDNGLTTSRSPEDLSAFCDKLVEEVREGRHDEQTV